MARIIDIQISNWRATGQTVQTPQYSVEVLVTWREVEDGAIVQKSHLETVLFPNALADVPAAWVRDELSDLLVRVVKAKLGIGG